MIKKSDKPGSFFGYKLLVPHKAIQTGICMYYTSEVAEPTEHQQRHSELCWIKKCALFISIKSLQQAILKVFNIFIIQSFQLLYIPILFGPKETTVAMDDGRAAWRSIFAQLLCAAEYSTMPDSYHSKNTPGNCCPSVHNSLDS